MPRIPINIADTVGNTPMVRLTRLLPDGVDVELYGKLEAFNPGGSVKDRIGVAMLDAAERDGLIEPGRTTIVEATSGNTGIALAWIGAALGYGVTLCMPENAGAGRKRVLAALGAEVVLTDPQESTDGSIREARRMVAADPERWAYLDQYSNPANWRAHFLGTAEEIWRQTSGRLTHLVAGIGTSGTLVGTSRRLKQLDPRIEVVAVQPDSAGHAIEGLKDLPTAILPPIYDPATHDRTLEVTTEEAVAMAKAQARRGLLLGWSAGAALVVAARVARERPGARVVAILPDAAERYLGDPLWEDQP
jgi:cysteine synthase B